MKRRILGLVAGIFGLTSGAFAQSGITIQHDGVGPNLAGDTLEIYLYGSHPDLVAGAGTIDVHFLVTNGTNNDGLWRITRKELSVPSSWIDQLCWPPNCYPTTDVLYTTPNGSIPTIMAGTSTAQTSLGNLEAELKPRITPSQSAAGYGHYRYYINEGGSYLDSVDLFINFTLDVPTQKLAPEIKVSPNPATDYVNISLSTNETAQLKVVDVLGNVVLRETISGSKKLDLVDFRNGVYFIVIETGDRTISRKLIVRH